MFDLTVVGAGLAGLQVAHLAARAGASVLLVDARRDVTERVRTTGIFVRRTFEEFRVLDPFLGPAVRDIVLHSPGEQTIAVTANHDEFRVGRMKPLYRAMLQHAIAAGVRWMPSTAFAAVRKRTGFSEVVFRNGRTVFTRFVVGADGARSQVARALGLSENHQWIAGIEHVYRSPGTSAPRFDCWIDPRIAPGYLAWRVDDGEEVHAGVGGDRARFDPASALRAFEARIGYGGDAVECRGGLIPVNGVLPRIGCDHGLLVGDAAGAVSPLTAGGLDACMRLSAHAANVLVRALSGGQGVTDYDGAAFRARFASRIAMRRIFDLATRSVPLIELGFRAARTALANRLVRHVFLGRGSFPDVGDRHRIFAANR